jgi:hypothetical protein
MVGQWRDERFGDREERWDERLEKKHPKIVFIGILWFFSDWLNSWLVAALRVQVGSCVQRCHETGMK